MTCKQFSYYHIHHGLTQEKFGREEGRLALLAPLPTIEAMIHNFTFFHQENCFVTPYTFFLVQRTPTCSIPYRFRGSPSLITPHLLPISNYTSASLVLEKYWKLSLPEHTGLWTAGCWLARRLHQLKASTTMDLGISIFLISVRCVALRNLDSLIKTGWSVICLLCC